MSITKGPVLAEQVQESVHGSGLAGRFNAWVAVKITQNVGTMWAAYLFAIIGTIGIAAALTDSVFIVLLVGAISGYFLQLVLLPIIMVGQNVSSAHADARAEKDFETNVKAEQEIEKVLEKLLSIEEQQNTILKGLSTK